MAEALDGQQWKGRFAAALTVASPASPVRSAARWASSTAARIHWGGFRLQALPDALGSLTVSSVRSQARFEVPAGWEELFGPI